MTSRRRQSARATGGWSAFTLIELLVVVAIIALLISILLPSLHAARSQARQVACLNNLRQLSLGVMYYCDDYRGVIPAFSSTGKPKTMDPSPENRLWAEAIDVYVPTECVSRIDGRVVFADIHSCPDKLSNEEEGDPAAPILGSYGMNAYLCSFVGFWLNKPQVVFDWINRDAAPRPAETVLLSESCRIIVTPALSDASDPFVHGPLVARHDNLDNSSVAWLDGHVECPLRSKLIESKRWWDLEWYPDKPYRCGFPDD